MYSSDEPEEEPAPVLPPSCSIATVTWEIEDIIEHALQTEPDPGTGPPNRKYVPSVVQAHLIHWIHSAKFSAHPGISRTVALINRRFWWSSIHKDVKEYVLTCSICAPNRSSHQPPAGLLQPLAIPKRPWSHISIDFVTGFPLSKGTNDKKQTDPLLESFEYFTEKGKEDDLHKSYNDRSYLSSEDTGVGESRTDFVALLTGVTDSWLPSSSGVARARLSLTRTSITFSITYLRFGRPGKLVFLDSDGTTAFEFKVPKGQSDMICGVWKNVPKPLLRQLQSEQMHISMTTSTGKREEIQGKIIKHRALFAETFSSVLTSDEDNSGMGGIAMLTLSDSENNLHFILILQGLIRHKDKEPILVPIRVQLMYRQHVLREVRANITSNDPDFAEVLTDLNSRELFWLSRGQLEIVVATEDQDPRQILGFITGRKSCDTIQSVMSSGDALTPGKTGGVGSAVFNLNDNGTLEYQVQVAGLSSDVVGLTIELKPRRRNKRSVLYDLTPEFSQTSGQAVGSWSRLEARHIHMLLQNELFINVATAHSQEGELRGQIKALPYSGLEVPRQGLPTPLAGHFLSPPVRTGASGHAWVSVDKQCHLHYEIVVAGLSKKEDVTVNAHLHGLAEIGELDNSSTTHKRLLTGFYGSQAQGILKDLSLELLQHLDQGTAFIQVSTKLNPQGEIRGRVHVPNSCESGAGAEVEEAELDDTLLTDPEELKKDPNTCFFENQHHAHGSRWTPNYDKCFTCSCQKRTVICDPVICPVLTCSRTIQPEDKCCPICDEKREPKDMKAGEKVEEHPEGCYFEGDQKMHAPGISWHPFVPPFGYIKCAVCTCKGSSGEVHCEKVTCPVLVCSHPVRRNPSDCCKECPEEERTPAGLRHTDMMQADGPRHCKFGKNYYQNSDSWHPWVPLVGEMKCINCWCDHGVTKCQRKQCAVLTCSNITRTENSCCPECADSKEQDDLMVKTPDRRRAWRH
ncbi:chordin isoform X2 [Austrofundulus limnaeus]|uniref:Chordin n=1 Tax=Austrofundulus limnaeus TaxID=52670 RepID=A0A2I4CME6_AUSLI|nr:PREDICTED: chordin isoform X2 [Austrofundulus limnaeus]